MNFDLLGSSPASPKASAAETERVRNIDRMVKRRRQLLLAHQALGFISLASLAATLVIGQLNYDDKYGSGTDTKQFYNAHLGLAAATGTTFALTGIFALAAPNPYPKPIRGDAAFFHKMMMVLATAGMIAEGVLGPITASREGKLDQRDYALAHLVTGYATGAFMAAGVLAFVF